MAAAVDSGFVAAAFGLPETTITTLQQQPTVDLVQILLEHIENKAREYEAADAAKLQLEVELETLARENEGISRHVKETSEKQLKEVESLRHKLTQEENARASLDHELQTLKSTSAEHKAEVEALNAKLADLEGSKRAAVLLAESKQSNHSKLTEELTTQQQKVNNLRRELAEIEEKRQIAENNAANAKFREQSLEQELEALKKHNVWLDEELSRRGADHTKFRKEKNARITELQRQFEEASNEVDGLRRTETALRSRVNELTQKAEDSISRIQRLQEEALQAEESHRTELDNSRRLGDLHQQSAEAARSHAQELQNSLSQIRDEAADEIGRLQAEVDNERQEREANDNRIAELESQLDRARTESTSRRNGSVPATPRRGMNGSQMQSTPNRFGSPGAFASPAGQRVLNHADHQQVKALIEYEQRRSQRLSTTIDEMVREMEARKPELDELRTQFDHASSEVTRLTEEMELAQREREKNRKELRRWQGEVAGVTKESELLRQQVRDLGLQLKIILVEQQAEKDGVEDLNMSQRLQFEQILKAELDESALQGMSESGRYISQRLTIFRNVAELQEQNTQLLTLTRRLTEQMEGEEARLKQSQQDEERAELDRLRERIVSYEENIKVLENRSESYVKERDMFRQLLSRRGPASTTGVSLDGRDHEMMSPNHSRAQSVNGDGIADQAKLLRELQTSFDSYRQETGTDRAALRQQAEKLGKEKNELQSNLAQARSQLSMAQERYDLLTANFNMLKNEHAELQKRAQNMSDAAIKQETRTQQAVEELVETKGIIDGFRIEIASLKAEREIWKKLEGRMEEDIKNLVEERSRLNRSLSDLQKLQSERELRDAETRRGLQDRIASVDTEFQSVRRQLESEQEASRQAFQRREYEQEQNRSRVDDLLKGISNVKEDLTKARTERDQLSNRVEELKLEIKNAELKSSALLQPRQSTRPTVVHDENAPLQASATDAATEQDDNTELETLRNDLQHTQRLLELARESEERYKTLFTASNEEITSLNEIYEQYRQESETILAEKDAKIAELEKRADDAATDLAKLVTELTRIQDTQAESAQNFETQRQQMESDLLRLRDDNERLTEATQLHREDLKAQAEIAQQAQQSYEDELIKHSEAAKALQKVRQDYVEIKSEVTEFKMEAQSAKETLEKSTESWNEQKTLLEKEITELRIRRADVNEQNQVLHRQLENFSKQLDELKKAREIEVSNGTITQSPATNSNDNYQEIVRHLQREKQIVDMQYDLSAREAKRLQHQLEHTQQQLDETRDKLAREMRAQIESERIQMDRDKLTQSINELSVFKESNALLRIEATQAKDKVQGLEQQIEGLRTQLDPLRERNNALENELEMKKGELVLLEENRDFWQKRTQDIMSKHNRADPAEVESLKAQLATIEAERDQLQTEKAPLQEQVDGIEDRIRIATEDITKGFEERRAKLIEQSKAKVRYLMTQVKEQKTQTETAVAESARLAEELSRAQSELQAVKVERDNASASLTTALENKAQDAEEGQIEEATGDNAEKAELEAKIAQAHQSLSDEAARAAKAVGEMQALQARIATLESETASLQQQLQDASAANQQDASTNVAVSETPAHTTSATAPGADELERLQNELSAAQKEVETLRTTLSSSATENPPVTSNTEASTESTESANISEAQIQAQVDAARAELQAKHDEVLKSEQEKFKTRVDNMKTQLNNKLREGRTKAREEVAEEHRQELEKLRAEHSAELERLKAEHLKEMQDLRAAPQPAGAQLTEQPQAATESTPAAQTAEPSEQPVDLANLTEDQVKGLLQTNQTIKGLISRNLRQKIEVEREKIVAQAKEEQTKAVEQAKEMESKRFTIKLNMSDNRAKSAQAKIDVVEQAANTTPARPVGEVWEIAKVAKPAANAPAKPAIAAPASAPSAPPAKPAEPSATSTPANKTPAATPTTASTAPPIATSAPPATSAAAPSETPKPVQPAPATGAGQGQPPVNPFAAAAVASGPPAAATASTTQPSQLQPPQAGGLPPRPAGIGGTGPAALRGIIGQGQSSGIPQSAIPRPGGIPGQGRGRGGGQGDGTQQGVGGTGRGGSNLPRGGGRGGRGGVQGAAGRGRGGGGAGAGAGAAGSGGSPMNPGARQFTPGGKRPADGSPGGENDGKRARGGGGGGGA